MGEVAGDRVFLEFIRNPDTLWDIVLQIPFFVKFFNASKPSRYKGSRRKLGEVRKPRQRSRSILMFVKMSAYFFNSP